MDDRHREILHHCLSELEKDLEPKKVLSELTTVLDTTDVREVYESGTRVNQVNKLLDFLPRRGPNAFNVFVKALKEKQPHLAITLQNAEMEMMRKELKEERASSARTRNEVDQTKAALEEKEREHKETLKKLEELMSEKKTLMAKSNDYEKDTFDNTQWRHTRVTAIHILSICKHVSILWRELGILLELPPAEVRDLENDTMLCSERAWKVMERWLQVKGSTATLGILIDALEKIGERRAVKMLMEVGMMSDKPEVTQKKLKEITRHYEALMTENEKHKKELGHPSLASTVCNADVSVSSAGSLSPSQATKQEQKNIVATAMKFEAEHKELVRALVYSEGGVNAEVQLYVQCGELGIPKELKKAAQECFREMEVTLEWLDLINDADRILKIRPLEYPRGTPQSLTDSQASEISKAIRDNLHVLVRHRNITALEPSLRVTDSKQTDTPCITLYVLRKGIIPDGECDFPLFLGSYPVDVVDGFWIRTDGPWKPSEAQEKREVLRLGASIGVQGEDSAGTLGAIVKGGDEIYALSCDHVMKHENNSEIIHPAQNDHLNYLKYHLQEYGSWLRNIVNTDISVDQLTVDDLTEQDQLEGRFKKLEELRQRYRDRNKEEAFIMKELNEHKKRFEEGLEALPRVIGRYSAGVSRNVTWNGRTHYIDAAVAELTQDEKNRLQGNPTAVVIGTGYKPSGEVSSGVEAQGKLHKSGRTTGYTGSGEISTEHHLFTSCSLCELNRRNPALLNVLRNVKLCAPCSQRRTEFSALKSPTFRCDYCTQATDTLLNFLCLYNCLCIKNKEPFPAKGDSGAVLFEMDKNRKLRGFGIIFGVHVHSFQRYALASPLDIALKTLADEISVDNLKLLSNYGE